MLLLAVYSTWTRVIDFFTDFLLVYRIYEKSREPDNQKDRNFLIAQSISFISAISAYLIGYSALLNIELSAGSYEPDQIKKRSCIARIFKSCFLSFVGPLYLLLLEMIQFIQAVCMLLGLFAGQCGAECIEGFFDMLIM